MQKLKIVLSYDGSRFRGFAPQKGGVNTVYKALKSAFLAVGINSDFNASGRTDKGVHASFQVIDIVAPLFWSDFKRLKNELNKKLKPYIKIKDISKVDIDFHSRYSAKRRVYRYVVKVGEFDPFLSSYVGFVNSLDKKLIKDAIKEFEGVHNFESFKKAHGGTTNYVREIYKTRFYKYKDFYIFYFEANGYLRSQIRMMVDFLFKISDGKLTIQNLKEQLQNQKIYSRTLADAGGLYLAKVKYF